MEIFADSSVPPMSPMSQYFNSSEMSVSILGVFELQTPISPSQAISFITDSLLPTNPRFSSIMVNDMNGERKWKKVEVKPEEHVFVPTFPSNSSLEKVKLFDAYLNEYMTDLALQQLPQNRPLWEIHVIQYPTSNAAGNIVFKFHHSLGDGYSLMSLIFTCLKRADDPSLPLTFPSRKFSENSSGHILNRMSHILSSAMSSVSDFGWSIIKSSVVEDDLTPIRSGGDGVQFRPITIWSISFPLHQIKQIKSKLKSGMTVNDVVTGMIFLGIRLYMQESRPDSTKSDSTALVMLNTRMFGNYKSVQDMLNPNSDAPWGNRVAFLHIDIPKVTHSELSDSLQFIKAAQKLILRKRNSSAVFFVDKLLDMIHKFRGPEEAGKYVYKTMKNSSVVISNMIGPKEKMALMGHSVKGFYFSVAGLPQSRLMISILSYMEKVRITFANEKEFIDQEKLKSCMEKAFKKIHKASMHVSM